MTATTPRVTAANPFQRMPAARDRTVDANGLDGVLRAGRRKTAAAGGTKNKKLRGRNRPAIGADGANQNMLGWIHGRFSKPARRSVVK